MKSFAFYFALVLSCLVLTSMAQAQLNEYDKKVATFFNWLTNNGYPDDRTIGYSGSIGGIIANRDISANETFTTIPNKFIISIDKVRKSASFKNCLDQNSGLNEGECVVLFFIGEYASPNSFWRPYFDMLPTNLNHLPLFWTEDELSHLQVFKDEFKKGIEKQKAGLQEAYQRVLKYLAANPDQFRYLSVSYETWQWAALTFQTRSYKYPVGAASCLVPVNDMLPHATGWTKDEIYGFSQGWIGENDDLSMVVKLNKPVRKEEIVFSVFSPTMNSGMFLFSYGFVPGGDSYAADYVDTGVPVLYQNDTDYAQKANVLAQIRLWPERDSSRILFVQSGVPYAILGAMRLSELTAPQFQELKDRNVTLNFLLSNIYSLDNEWAVYRRLMSVTSALLAPFPTTAEQDAQLLASPEVRNTLTRNSVNAIRYRKYYKEMLLNARKNIMERWMSLLVWKPQPSQEQALAATP